MCANGEGSGENAQMRRLVWAFIGRLCDKYHNLMSWLNFDDNYMSIIFHFLQEHGNSEKILKASAGDSKEYPQHTV